MWYVMKINESLHFSKPFDLMNTIVECGYRGVSKPFPPQQYSHRDGRENEEDFVRRIHGHELKIKS